MTFAACTTIMASTLSMVDGDVVVAAVAVAVVVAVVAVVVDGNRCC